MTEPLDGFYFEIIRKEDDGSRTCVRRDRIPSRAVFRILGKYIREKLLIRRGRRRGRPARADITKALRLSRQGVPKKEICKQLSIPSKDRCAFKKLLWQRERRQKVKARKARKWLQNTL